MRHLKLLIATASATSLALSGVALAAAAHTSATAPTVSTKKTSLGIVLVNGSGRTLYLDSADKPGHPACTGGCLSVWPPLKANGKLTASGAAKSSLLGTVTSSAGTLVTYAGHPLYTFISDSSANPTSGEGQHGFYAVSPTGSKVVKSTSDVTKPGQANKKPPSQPTHY